MQDVLPFQTAFLASLDEQAHLIEAAESRVDSQMDDLRSLGAHALGTCDGHAGFGDSWPALALLLAVA